MNRTPISFPLSFHTVHVHNAIVNTITTIALQLDEIPTITPRMIIRKGADPDGAAAGTAGAGSRGEIALILTRRIFGEEVSEEWLEEGRTATDETGVDFDDASGTRDQRREKEMFKSRGSKRKGSR